MKFANSRSERFRRLLQATHKASQWTVWLAVLIAVQGAQAQTAGAGQKPLRFVDLTQADVLALPAFEIGDADASATTPPVTGTALSEFIEKALEISPQLQQVRAQLATAEAGRKVARADLLPSLSLRRATGPEKSRNVGEAADKHTYSQNAIRLTQPLINATLFNEFQGSRQAEASAQYRLQAAYDNVVMSVLRATVDVATARLVLDFSNIQLAQLQNILTYLETRVSVGAASPSDLERARTRVLNARQTRIEQQANYRNATLELTRLTSLTPQAIRLPDTARFPAIPESSAQLQALAMAQNPEILALKSDVEAQQSRIKAEMSRYMPVVGSLTTTADISKKDVTLTSITAANKVYDGYTTASITSGAITTGVGTETLSVTGSGTFSDQNAATGKTVTVSDVTTLTKADGTGSWSNYNLTTTGSLTTTADISKKDVTLTSITAANKVYDGYTTASITSGAITTGVGTETLSVTGSGTFSDKNAATSKTVTVSDVTALTKADGTGSWNNYNLTTTGQMTTTADITKKALTATATVADKVYDAGVAATVSSTSSVDIIYGDSVSINPTLALFVDKNVARDSDGNVMNKTVTVSGLSLNGSDAGNYSLQNTTFTGVAKITPKPLSASGAVADKIYDGTLQAYLGDLGGSGVVPGDGVVFKAASALFADKNVARDGSGLVQSKAVTVSGLSLAGADAGNYQLSANSFTTQAKILPKTLTAPLSVQNKTYDGNTSASVSMGALSGLVGAESIQATAWGLFDTATAGSNKPVVVRYRWSDGANGGLAGNYELPSQTLTASILSPSGGNPVQPMVVPTPSAAGGLSVMFGAASGVVELPIQTASSGNRQGCGGSSGRQASMSCQQFLLPTLRNLTPD